MMLQNGAYNRRQIVPEAWVRDIHKGGDAQAWKLGGFYSEMKDRYGYADGSYRSYWYVADPKLSKKFACTGDCFPDNTDRNLVESDRLRLDVAVGANGEMFSWHGQKSFQTEEIDRLVTAGPVSSGNYFSFLASIFVESVAKIDFVGFRKDGDRQVAVFQYAVPLAKSGFETRTSLGKATIGYHGEFTVDLANRELEQLEIVADDLPESAFVYRYSSKTRYRVTVLNGTALQVPVRVDMNLFYQNHERAEVIAQYQQCHEFKAESVLRFDTATTETENSAAKPTLPLPSGLSVRIKINSQVDLASAWAGDEVDGELAEDLMDAQGKQIAPVGTTVHGLLVLADTGRRPSSYTVAVTFRELSVAGVNYKLDLKSVLPLVTEIKESSVPSTLEVDNLRISDDHATCRFRSNRKLVKLKGVVTFWVTS